MAVIVRVELHQGDNRDYLILHRAMRARGFAQEVAADGRDYELPPGLYHYPGANDSHQVLTLAKAAANDTGRASAIVACNYGDLWFAGLSPKN